MLTLYWNKDSAYDELVTPYTWWTKDAVWEPNQSGSYGRLFDVNW